MQEKMTVEINPDIPSSALGGTPDARFQTEKDTGGKGNGPAPEKNGTKNKAGHEACKGCDGICCKKKAGKKLTDQHHHQE